MKRLGVAPALVVLLAACERNDLIVSPAEGDIVPPDSATVSGVIPPDLELGGTMTVNGVDAPIAPDRTWATEIPLNEEGDVTPIEAIYRRGGAQWRHQSAIVGGPKIDDNGQFSPNGVGLQLTNTGLSGLGPVVNNLAAGSFDISGLILSQHPLVHQDNAFLLIDITGDAYDAGAGAIDIVAASTPQGVTTDITVHDLYVGLDLTLSDGLLINQECRLELQIPATSISALFDLAPDAADPAKLDVNLLGSPTVDPGTVNYEFISGICDGDTFLIGDIVNLVAGPQVQTLVASGFSSQLGDPDGAGPADSPIADAMELVLAEVSVAGPVGEAVHAKLNAPFTSVTETATAIDLRSDADFAMEVGTGPAQCQPPATAPDLTSTFDVAGEYPILGATTPSGAPYGMGLVMSESAFNQLLGAMTECGLLNQDLHEINLGGNVLQVTSTVLSFIVPEFASALPANTPMLVRLDPYIAPYLTQDGGPGGEPAELMLADLHISFVQPTAAGDKTWLTLAVDAPLGFELGYDAVSEQLAPTITPPTGDLVSARVLDNTVRTDENVIEAVFASLFPNFVNELGSGFGAFPLPTLLGLEVVPIEVARQNNSFVLYADLVAAPLTRLANAQLTDLSSADSVTDSIFDVNEWRHRLTKTTSASTVKVNLKGMVGADACCTTGDEERSAHAGYRLTFDVIPENGDSWQVDLSHVLNGAHTLLDEQGGSAVARFDTPISVRARVGSGAWQVFDSTPSVTSASSGNSGNVDAPFSASNALVLQGATAETITLEVGFDVFAKSDSNLLFPAVAGDEGAVRFGVNDTIANGFTAGEYPGLGNRNIGTDGHVATIQLTAIPSG